MSTDEPVRLLLCTVAAAVLVQYRRQISEAIESFTNNFPRGGPPSPMHPSPGVDDEPLRSGKSKKTSIDVSVR